MELKAVSGRTKFREAESCGSAWMWRSAILFAILLSVVYTRAYGSVSLDVETGGVFSGYNDVRIPGDSGTLISLSQELTTDPAIFVRVRLTYRIQKRHSISVLVAPLSLRAEGEVDRLVRFEGEEFPPNVPLKSVYRFNSYRVTYRYDFCRTETLKIGAGLTAKIRDASISMEGAQRYAEKKNTGFVPLIHVDLDWMFSQNLGLMLNGDALAAPQGRAEDVLCALHYRPSPSLHFKFGYRILEGGADVDEVYNFTLLNYAVVGAIVTF